MPLGWPRLYDTVEQWRVAQQHSQALYCARHSERDGTKNVHSGGDVEQLEDEEDAEERRVHYTHKALTCIHTLAAQLRLNMGMPLIDWLDDLCHVMKMEDNPTEAVEARLSYADEDGPIWTAAHSAWASVLDAHWYLTDIKEWQELHHAEMAGVLYSTSSHLPFSWLGFSQGICYFIILEVLAVPRNMKLKLPDFDFNDHQKAMLEASCIPYIEGCNEAIKTGNKTHANYIFDSFATEWFVNYPVEARNVLEHFVAEEEKKEELRSALVAAYHKCRAACLAEEPVSRRDNSAWDAYIAMMCPSRDDDNTSDGEGSSEKDSTYSSNEVREEEAQERQREEEDWACRE
ncbi:hypothetical protein EV421DRAFT_1908376 [Armillaria borealis]|uniref:Uncharacterized protein n=1 Tax=Armillaria borealis TaxID=47425 RepID=A0AA39MJE0_9AGAR|nr:hypothetical protein EV421DRAFT_1908376 [Armillaria borealis]